jgi:hypothetical protein
MLLQFVFRATQMRDPQDDEFGVAFGQFAPIQQHAGIWQKGQEQQPVPAQRGEQVHLGCPDGTRGDPGDGPVQQSELAASAGTNARR